MEKHMEQQINILTDIIRSIVPVEQIYLFGSYSSGKPHEDSDIDLYVVTKDSVVDCMEASIEIRKAMYKKQSMPVDLIVSTASDFQKRSHLPTLERQIAEEGLVLYG